MKYKSFIESAKLIKTIESVSTTGDVEYNGTALEISEKNGDELFHIIVDENGELQILFFASDKNYRMSLELLDEIISKAKQIVIKTE